MNSGPENVINPALPEIASYVLRKEKLEEYAFAMADVLCWLNGFVAAGGLYSPGSIESLRDLTDVLKSIQAGTARSNQSHE